MRTQEARLPEFNKPPVVEVALSIQFDPVEGLGAPQLGLLWSEFRADFPRTEEQPPLEPDFERFDSEVVVGPSVRIESFTVPPVPRLWFLNEAGTELIQVQQTRFISNWRRQDDQMTYPRYEYVKKAFADRFAVFQRFVERESLGKIAPNQCEVTYVNHVGLENGKDRRAKVEDVLAVWRPEYTDAFLHEPEDVNVGIRYVIRDSTAKPVGRLHLRLEPVIRKTDRKPMLLLSLAARGQPLSEDLAGAYGFLDLGHEWLVRSFAALTTQHMHALWGRKRV